MQLVQRRLEGEGAEYRRELYRQVEGQYDPEKVREFSGLLCDELKRERLRIGGDWAVASAWLNNRGVRDAVRWVGGRAVNEPSRSFTVPKALILGSSSC